MSPLIDLCRCFGAPLAEAPKNNLVIADQARADALAPGQLGDIDSLDVVQAPAAFANKMMMTFEVGVVADGTRFQNHFPNYAGLSKGVKIVIDRGAGCARVGGIDRQVDLLRGGMLVVAQQVVEYSVPLGRAAQRGLMEGLLDDRLHRDRHGSAGPV